MILIPHSNTLRIQILLFIAGSHVFVSEEPIRGYFRRKANARAIYLLSSLLLVTSE